MSDAKAGTGNPVARWAKLALPWLLTILILEYFRRRWNLAAIADTRPTLTDAMLAEFEADIEQCTRL